MQLIYCQELQSFFLKICGIYLAIEKWRTSDIPKVEEISALMKEKFKKYWTDVHGLMW
jgi:septum formation inhibitor MinC